MRSVWKCKTILPWNVMTSSFDCTTLCTKQRWIKVGTLFENRSVRMRESSLLIFTAMVEIRNRHVASRRTLHFLIRHRHDTLSELPHLIFLVDPCETSAEYSCVQCKVKGAFNILDHNSRNSNRPISLRQSAVRAVYVKPNLDRIKYCQWRLSTVTYPRACFATE